MKNILLLIALTLPFVASAQKKLNVLATNSWTASYARAAGIENVDQLAPSSLLHPSEYELQISDLEKIKNADLIIFAGYEVVMTEIRQSLKIDEKKYLKIETKYDENRMIEQIQRIASMAGTKDKATTNVLRLQKLFAEARTGVENAGLKGKPVIVHFFHKALAESLGLIPVAVIGPAPLELFNLGELAKKEAAVIIDNAHNPIAQPLSEIKRGIPIVEWLNFPGTQHTSTIEDVLRYNVNVLLKR
jgi:zinc transport system substrate-binding protein